MGMTVANDVKIIGYLNQARALGIVDDETLSRAIALLNSSASVTKYDEIIAMINNPFVTEEILSIIQLKGEDK